MKPLCLAGISLFLTIFLQIRLYGESQPEDPAHIHMGNGIAVIVEGQIITLREVRREVEPIIPRIQVESKNAEEFHRRIDELSREVLQNMIDRIVIVRAAEKKGLSIPSDYIEQEYNEIIARDFGSDRKRFLEYLKVRGETTDEFRENIYNRVAVNAMRAQVRNSQPEVSPRQIEDFYLKNKLRFYQDESIHLRQIILTASANEDLDRLRQTAGKIMEALNDGASFIDIAHKYGRDGRSRRGGDWGWVERKDIRKELGDIAFNLKPNRYSQPIELEGTLFILYVEDKREECIRPIAQVRDIIENMLLGEATRKAREKWLQNLRDKAHIRYFI